MPFLRPRFIKSNIIKPPILVAGALGYTLAVSSTKTTDNTDKCSKPILLNEPSCYNCNNKFGIFTWRYHCKKCGHSFCNNHVNTYVKLPMYGYTTPVRVCSSCYKDIEQYNSTLDNVLFNNQSN